MKSGLLLLLFSLSSYVVAQEGGDLDSLISDIFEANTENSNPNPAGGGINLQPTGTVSGPNGCKCVPYYLCINNTIVTDGASDLDITINDGPCDYLSVCCNPPEKLHAKEMVAVP